MNPIYRLGRRLFLEIARGFYGYEAAGRENIRFPGAAIIVCNHISFFDPPLVGIAFDEAITYLARKTLFSHPIVGWVLRKWQSVPVDQDRPDPGSLKNMLRCLREGKKILVFPEGSRSMDGTIQKGEPGVGLLIAKAGAPVLPVRIFGSYEALPRGSRLPQPSRITVVFGKPWTPILSSYQESGKDLYQKLADEAMERIAELHL